LHGGGNVGFHQMKVKSEDGREKKERGGDLLIKVRGLGRYFVGRRALGHEKGLGNGESVKNIPNQWGRQGGVILFI